jgi:leucyl aminopeptidase
MKFSIKKYAGDRAMFKARTDAVVVGVFEDAVLDRHLLVADKMTDGQISRHVRLEGFTGAAGSAMSVREPQGLPSHRLLIVGLGKADSYDREAYDKAAQIATKQLGPAATSVTWALPAIERWADDLPGFAVATVRALRASVYVAGKFRSEAVPPTLSPEIEVFIAVKPPHEAALSAALRYAVAIADGIDLSRNLGNAPGNICTPEYLEQAARKLGERHALHVEAFGPKELEALKMEAFLTVAKGSEVPPRMIVMRHDGGKPGEPPVVLVGKGVTFDAGGISIKPSAAMDEMKFDMCGAAAVIGVMQAAAELSLGVNLVGIVVACENLPGSRAYKPGDVIAGMSGKTVEVLNTDAEGRLILSDALTYAARFEPAVTIDIATLTGACVVALGHHHSGLFSNDETIAAELLASGVRTGDTAWRMPLGAAYHEPLRSNIADMVNLGGAAAGASTAACFLERFVEKRAWAHLDIAGTAWKSGPEKSATGRPVAMLVDYLAHRAAT